MMMMMMMRMMMRQKRVGSRTCRLVRMRAWRRATWLKTPTGMRRKVAGMESIGTELLALQVSNDRLH
jgi:hypothetical protein